jgi:DNA invertase Pin-like site-specific DNA recombinase
VSTAKQGADGYGVDAQRGAIDNYLALAGFELAEEFIEVESGGRIDRPVLETALLACRRQKATLLVAKLDRLSRTVAFLSRLVEAKVDFVAVDNPHANKLMVHMLAAFAEHERDMIAARTKAALASAKARGIRLGNPRLQETRPAAQAAITRRADQHCANVLPLISAIRQSGITTYAGIAAALDARGVQTDRGGRWHPATVRNLELRGAGTIEVRATRCTNLTSSVSQIAQPTHNPVRTVRASTSLTGSASC